MALLLLAGCGREQQPALTAALTAALTSPVDVELRWEPEAGVEGQVVEYANETGGAYVALGFVGPGVGMYEHPDLIPRTSFHYRVRSFRGPASEVLEVALPPGDEVPEADGHEWAEPVTGASGVRPVRDGDAAPTGFRAEVEHANGVLFSWVDQAEGEEGYFLEAKPSGAADFAVVAQLDPDVRSFGLITLPAEKNAAYRVRAYYSGATTNVARVTTGEPPG
ncbi:fibronectin type III domain-containing protein [Saccharothrix xinjiangensis]